MLKSDRIVDEKWYHSIELLPGLFTKGWNHDNIAVTRALLRGCEVEGLKCLDIGAQDFLITLLLLRRGAGRVIAYDRLTKEARADFLKSHFSIDFEYIHSVGLSDLPVKARELGAPCCDVIVFSGVLYHMFDPLAGLATVRGLVRNGGLLILETAAVPGPSSEMFFNAEGRFYFGTNYWQISTGCLDYLLRFLRLSPIDCLYLGPSRESFSENPNREDLIRIGVVCRALDRCLPSMHDDWMVQSIFERDFSQFLDWSLVSNASPEVGYVCQNKSLVLRQDTGSIDIYRTIQASPAIAIQDPDSQIRLKLGAVE